MCEIINFPTVKKVSALLNKNKNKNFTITTHIGGGEPTLTAVEKPGAIICDYIDKETGHALTLYFENFSFEWTEEHFAFQIADCYINDKLAGNSVVVVHKGNDDTYTLIDFN